MSGSPTIVAITFDRLNSLSRLLDSLLKANYNGHTNVRLIISIDGGGSKDVITHSNSFAWPFGDKIVIKHQKNLGLRNHVLSCGDLTSKWDEVIILEDDCIVGPEFYNFAVHALRFYNDDIRMAGISLYSYQVNEYAQLPFQPINNGYDNFFMQVPSSWGQAWTKFQWSRFKNYYKDNMVITDKDKLPETVKGWPESSWKKYFYKYIVENDLYVVYPFHSHTSNFSELGTHVQYDTSFLQVPLRLFAPHGGYHFQEFSESLNKFDAYFEIDPKFLNLFGFNIQENFGMDLYGLKQLNLFSYNYVFSIKDCNNPIKKYDGRMFPLIQNLIFELGGDFISFAKSEDFSSVEINTKKKLLINTQYFGFWSGFKAGMSEGVLQVQHSNTYKLGTFLLKPFQIFKKKSKH
ncbi:hypothetical protein [Flavihumibacter sp.]|uniref:hypothetical protein n=1 Tax=Flavihumibacter sp. TaxID=1913981 RepID=UPI002FC9C98A